MIAYAYLSKIAFWLFRAPHFLIPFSVTEQPLILNALEPYPLHLLGWKAFQDLCVSIAEECLRRPVQNYLPTNDAGRDGAFVGAWDGDDQAAGESTIQCKFTSRPSDNLTLSMLGEEIPKAANLATKGLAHDYIILTNHPVTGQSELAIKAAFEAAGVGRCRIFAADWITRQIKGSARLRMMVPRLYGLGTLSDLIDERAYEQAKLILSSMGDDLKRLVVTDAHKSSVRAISEHNVVLLLGEPAAGKSTIGAGIAVGAADVWGSNTIKATSPESLEGKLDPNGGQFVWIDDAFGSTQYQKQRTEAWNQLFPLMNAARSRGTRFLLTSRTYIWNAAKADLKFSGFPLLNKSQVVIKVEELSPSEKAQILYNHIKLGDQPQSFRTAIKPFLPLVAQHPKFLPETARRLGSAFLAEKVSPTEQGLNKFVAEPKAFLLETIASLAPDCRAAIAVIFLNGGRVRSPVPSDALEAGAAAFGATPAEARNQLQALDGNLLLLAQDEAGPYWTYKHPTVSDAFATYLAGNQELVEVYLRGANPYSIIYEVVCSNLEIEGAPLIIPDELHELLATRLAAVETSYLKTFISYRSNAAFAERMLKVRPTLLDGMRSFFHPIANDTDAILLGTLNAFGLLPEELRQTFFEAARTNMVESADASFLRNDRLRGIFTANELDELREAVREEVIEKAPTYVDNVRSEWEEDTEPDDHFYDLRRSFEDLVEFAKVDDQAAALRPLETNIRYAVLNMEDDYREASSTSAPVSNSTPAAATASNVFRDVDE